MDLKEIIGHLQKWQEEDKEKRGLVIITTQRISESEHKINCANTIGLLGPSKLLRAAIKCSMVNDSDLTHLILQAATEIHCESAIMNKNSSLS